MINDPKVGDTELMRAIRVDDTSGAFSLLGRGLSYINRKNFDGETAMFLALRKGNLPLVERLAQLGASDAIDIFSPLGKPIQLDSLDTDSPMTNDERKLLENPGSLLRTINFPTLKKLRLRLAAEIRNRHSTSFSSNPKDFDGSITSKVLSEEGVALLGQVLNLREVEDILSYLKDEPVYEGHTTRASNLVAKSFEDSKDAQRRQLCYSEDVTLNAPHLLRIANNPVILDTVKNLFGCTPTIFDINLMWSLPKKSKAQSGAAQTVHRDYDDFHTIVLFIYLTDVNFESGPHRYYRGTHDIFKMEQLLSRRFSKKISRLICYDMFRSFEDGYGRDSLVDFLFGSDALDICGFAGTAFLSDPFGLHKGVAPSLQPRLMAWIRYGVKSEIEVLQEQVRTGHDPYINRMLPAMQARILTLKRYKIALIEKRYQGSAFNIVFQNGSFVGVHEDEPMFHPTHYTYAQLDDIFFGRTGCPNILTKDDCKLDYPVFFGSSFEEVSAQIVEHVRLQ